MSDDQNTTMPTLLNRVETCIAAGGISPRTLDKRMAEDGFPRPLRMGRQHFWIRDEVAAYINELIEQRVA